MTTKRRLTLGIDEAGRGPGIGPMVMAAACLDTNGARTLSRAGLADSKSYGAGARARKQRDDLAVKVREVAIWTMTVVVDVATIDERVKKKELNLLEREVATEMIERAPQVDVIIADGKTLFAPLGERYKHLTAMNKAESHHASVAAASVLAKTRRDDIFARILSRYRGEFGTITGGGYVNAGTRAFLRAYAERYHQLPPEARCSWPHEYVADLVGDEIEAPSSDPEAQLGLF